MGLLGGDDGTSGWGVMPPPMSSNEWGSSGSGSSSSAVTSGQNNTSVGVNHWQTSSSSSSVVSGSLGASVSNNSSVNNNTSSMNQSVSSSVCRGQQSNNSTQQQSGPGELSTSPKLSSSWAQAAGKGLGLSSASTSSSGAHHSQQSNSISHDVSSSQQSQQQQIQTSQQCQSQAILGSNVSATTGGNVTAAAATSHNSSGQSLVMNNPNDANSNQSLSVSTLIGNNAGGSHHATSNPIDVSHPGSHKAAWASINKQGSASSSSIADVVGHVPDELRQTLLTDNWTNSVINHDSPWDIAPSPLSSPKDSSTWRCPAKAGTEIWESNVRQKKSGIHSSVSAHQLSGQMASNPVGIGSVSTTGPGAGMPNQAGPNPGMSQPWGQASTSNIGGTWGEEEDTTNHWNPVQPNPAPMPVGPVGSGSNQASSSGVGGMNGLSGLGGNYSSINNTWSGSSPMVNGSGQSGQSSAGTSNYPLIPPGGNSGSNFVTNNSNMNWNSGEKNFPEPRNKNANWGNFDESNEQQWDKGNAESSFGTWNPELKRDSWDKDSNDSYKGVDDGTSGWGNVVRQKTNSNWKPEVNKYGNNNSNNNTTNNNNNNNNKNNSNGFNPQGGNGGWNNSSNNNPNNNNNNKNYMIQRSWTNDGSSMHKSQQMWNQGTRSPNGSNNWGDGQIDTSQWGGDSRQKPLSREIIQTSKQYRTLVDQGFKANHVENALRNQNMNYDGAFAELKSINDYNMKNMNQGFNNGAMRPNKANSFGGGPIYNQYGQHQTNSQPQVKQMIERIQNAVNAGYLNAQILNQSLSNQDLELVSELLLKINDLQQFQNDHAYAQVHGGAKKELDEKVNQMKISISNLQTRLTMGPMVNMKSLEMGSSNQQVSSGQGYVPGNGLQNGPSPGNGYQMPGAGSRIHQWTKKNQQQTSEFARAPGPSMSKPTGGNWGFETSLGGTEWNQDFNLGKPEKHMLEDYSMNFQAPDQFGDHKWKTSGFGKGLGDEVDVRSPISNPMLKQDSLFPGQSWSGVRGQSSKSFNNPQPQMDPFSFDSNSASLWSFNSNGNTNAQANMLSQQQMFDMPKKALTKPGGVNPAGSSGWSAPGINTGPDFVTGEASLWNSVPGGSKPAGRPPPPGLSKSQSIWSSNAQVNDYGMGMSRGMAPQVDYNY